MVPEQEPHWDYNTPGRIVMKDRFWTWLLAGLCKAALKPVNYNKLSEVIQEMKKNFTSECKLELNPDCPLGHFQWHCHFGGLGTLQRHTVPAFQCGNFCPS